MLVYYYVMEGSNACILLYNGGFQCLLLYNGGFNACILLYNGGFQCLYIRVLLRGAKKELSNDI